MRVCRVIAKTTAQRVREAEAAHQKRGERQIRVWVPDQAEAIEQVRSLAAALCDDCKHADWKRTASGK